VSDPSNVRYLVEEATRLLCIGEGDFKRRLLCAYTQKLQYVQLSDLPDDLSPLLISIRSRLYRIPRHPAQSTVEAALYRLHAKTASTIAESIFELHRALCNRNICDAKS
jgi:hypothetical protein